MDCPLDCPYLAQAHEFEKPPALESLPHPDVEVSPEFLEEHEQTLSFVSAAILIASRAIDGISDADVREALAGLTETYLTLSKGVVYEHLPQNPLAVQIYRDVQRSLAEIQQAEAPDGHRVRDAELMRLLVFLERVAADRDNGRKRCKAFLGMLYRFHGRETIPETPSSTLILP